MKDAGASVQRISDLSSQISSERGNLKEIREAVSVGTEALASLGRIEDYLAHAEGWGTWDLLGGGLISGLAKHADIDDAKAEAENTERLLREFHAELADVRIHSDIRFETDGFAKFADFFFDGLIADWFMQSKIDQSQESVSRVQNQVRDAVRRLESMESQTDARIKKMEAERERLVNAAR